MESFVIPWIYYVLIILTFYPEEFSIHIMKEECQEPIYYIITVAFIYNLYLIPVVKILEQISHSHFGVFGWRLNMYKDAFI